MSKSIEVRFVGGLSFVSNESYKKYREDGKLEYEMLTIVGDGHLLFGAAAGEVGAEEHVQLGVDAMAVNEFRMAAYRDSDSTLFEQLPTLRRGDQVHVWLSVNYTRTRRDNRDYYQLKVGAITAVEVVSSAVKKTATRPAFRGLPVPM